MGFSKVGEEEDFVMQFMAYSEGINSPPLFRLWSAIALVAGALERRVWAKAGRNITYANLYTLLVAPPGVGKFIIEEVRGLWAGATQPGTKIPAFRVAPDSMTKASLIDNLAKAEKRFLPPGKPPLEYHSLLIPAEEFSILLPAYDMEYIGVLNGIWNNKEEHKESRRYGKSPEVAIPRPQLNILGGAQPAWLANLFPEDAWNTGLARRMLMIYSTDTPHRSLFYEPDTPEGLRRALLQRLGSMSQLYGQMKWEPAAAEALDEWYMKGPPNSGGPPVPEHTKLQHYARSRGHIVTKLVVIASASRSPELIIRERDVSRAIGWLLDAERVMPDVFRAMVGKSDKDVIAELQMFALAKFGRTRQSIRGEDLRVFLLERVPHEKVETLLMAADRAGIVVREAGGDTWMPRARPGGAKVE